MSFSPARSPSCSNYKRKEHRRLSLRRSLARLSGFGPLAFRLGEPLNICHLCSPMYRKVAIRQAFFVFRVAPCSSKFTGVVRCSPVHFSSFLDFSKKGNKNIFHLPPILALFRAKTHLQSNRESKQNISHLPEMYLLGKMTKKEYCIPGSNEIRVYNTLYVSGGPVIRPLF